MSGSGSHGGLANRQMHDLTAIWGDLRQGIDQIFARQGISRQRYIELYTHVHNYCTSVTQSPSTSSGPQGGGGGGGARGRGSSASAHHASSAVNKEGAQFVGFELYNKLHDFLKQYQVQMLKVGSM